MSCVLFLNNAKGLFLVQIEWFELNIFFLLIPYLSPFLDFQFEPKKLFLCKNTKILLYFYIECQMSKRPYKNAFPSYLVYYLRKPFELVNNLHVGKKIYVLDFLDLAPNAHNFHSKFPSNMVLKFSMKCTQSSQKCTSRSCLGSKSGSVRCSDLFIQISTSPFHLVPWIHV